MKLNDTACRNYKPLEKPYRKADGGGLYLEILPTGSKIWRLKYRFMGKENRLTFGKYPLVSLKEAREKRDAAKKQLLDGKDPSEIKKIEALQREEEYASSFEVIAREWHQQKKHTWKPDHAANIIGRLEKDLFPLIGKRPISHIEPPDLLAAIRKVDQRGANYLARRLMQSCGQIFRYAVATGKANRDITQDLKGAIEPRKTKGMAHLTERELPAFLKKLEHYDTEYKGTLLTKLAFKFLILTFVRSNEIRGAKWEEIEWDKKQWRIPAERMKMKEQHLVPLADQSIGLLKQIETISGDSYSGYCL